MPLICFSEKFLQLYSLWCPSFFTPTYLVNCGYLWWPSNPCNKHICVINYGKWLLGSKTSQNNLEHIFVPTWKAWPPRCHPIFVPLFSQEVSFVSLRSLGFICKPRTIHISLTDTVKVFAVLTPPAKSGGLLLYTGLKGFSHFYFPWPLWSSIVSSTQSFCYCCSIVFIFDLSGLVRACLSNMVVARLYKQTKCVNLDRQECGHISQRAESKSTFRL